MDSFIKIPIVAIFTNFYGIIGLHVYPIDWCSFSSILRVLWNVSLNILLFHRFHFCDPLYVEEIDFLFHKDKPLLNLLYNYDNGPSFLVTSSLTILYFSLYSRQIIPHLDSPLFRQSAILKYTGKWPLVSAISCTVIIYGVGYFGLIKYTFTTEPYSMSIYLNHLAMYITLLYEMLPIFMTHYIQYCTYINLEAISTQIGQLPAKAIIEQISALARLTDKLHCLLSVPLMGYFLANLIDWLVCFSYVGLDKEYRFSLYVAAMVLYLVYLVHLNEKTQICLLKISQLTTPGNDRLPLKEIQLYCSYFQWKLFAFIHIDNSFLIGLALFLANYTVLIWQTRK